MEPIKHTPWPWYLVWHGNEREPYPLSINNIGATSWIARDGQVSTPGNGRVLALAPTAPHTCTDPTCPGDRNRRKLEAAENMASVLKGMEPYFEPGLESDNIRWALAAWEGSNK